MNYVYMAVTNDKYELPVYVTETPGELAKIVGLKPDSLYSILSHKSDEKDNPNRKKRLLYLKVKV